MSKSSVALAVTAIAALVVAGWLYLENRELQRKLASARAAAPKSAREQKTEASGSPAASTDRVEPGRNAARAFLRGLGRVADRDRPALEAEPAKKKETRLERRQRRQERIAAMLGRRPNETEEQYRARMVPLIEMGLAGPRQRMKETRKAIEEKAGIDDSQHAKMDQVFDDAYKEVVSLTNKAIAEGELTPYGRNWSGILSYAGGLGAVLSTAEGRLAGILTPEQLRIISSSGFEWGEYLGVTAPWETLRPPPPPPGR